MAIDPDMQPILDTINQRLDAIESAAVPAGIESRLVALEEAVAGIPAEGSAAAEVRALGGVIRAEMDRLLAALVLMGGGPVEQVPVPEGHTRMGDFTRMRGDEGGAFDDGNNIVMTTWRGGAGTTGDPSLVDWNADGSVTISYENDGRRSGVLQFNEPVFTTGRIGAVVEVLGSDAVCAFFTYAGNKKEFDFELIKRNGELVWAVGIHMPTTGGGKVSSEKVYTPLKSGPTLLEIEADDDSVAFFVDGEQVALFTPADVPGANWDTTTTSVVLLSCEWHEGWAGHTEADYAKNNGRMRILSCDPS